MKTSIKPEQFSQLDHTVFEKYFTGIDRKLAINLYNKIAHLFLKNTYERLDSIKRAIEIQNQTDIVILAHQIKGSLLSLGGNHLAELFRKLEIESTHLSKEAQMAIFQKAQDQMPLFIEELKIWIEVLPGQ